MNVLGVMLTQCTIGKITTGNSFEMKHHICGRHDVLQGDVQHLKREKLDPY